MAPTPSLSFERLTVPQTVGRVLKVLGSQCFTFFQLAVTSVVPLLVVVMGGSFTLWAFFAHILAQAEKNRPDDNPDDDWKAYIKAVNEFYYGLLAIVVVGVVLGLVVTVAGRAAMIRSTAELYAYNEMADASTALQKGLSKFGKLLLAGILLQAGYQLIFALLLLTICMSAESSGMLALACLLFVTTPFLVMWLDVRLSLVYPAIVVEDSCSPIGGIKRSWQLTSGAFCDIFCCNFLFGFLFGLVLYVAAKAFVESAKHSETAALLLMVLVISLPNFFFMPCSAVLQTVIYIARRGSCEYLTQQSLARELGDQHSTLAEPLLPEATAVQLVNSSDEEEDTTTSQRGASSKKASIPGAEADEV